MTTSCSGCGQPVSVYRKRDRTLRIKIAGPGDLTDAKIWFMVKSDRDDADVDAQITKLSLNLGGSNDDAEVVDGYVKDTTPGSPTFDQMVGIIQVYIKPVDTENLLDGDYWYDCVIETSSSKRYQAIDPSPFKILQPVSMT